ncbi:MAG: UvrD-helicase domain-containing protein [Kiritimatiellae bacterium]|nr:UvrD-helicase domain-containing protein [Kiritimatiellia bacterium]
MSEENKVIKERLGERDAQGCFCDDKYVCNTIDYTRDAIIEASAGTGKTYTLQSIVLKLLLEGTIDSVKNLLLVTYTEKAAGELKDKIREVLDEAGCLPSDFDEVTICTIHSFCRSLLTEYAFENRVPMQVEIGGSDNDLIHRAVRTALQCAEFKARYGTSYGAYMEKAGLTSTDDLVAAAENELKDSMRLGQSPSAPDDVCNDVRRILQETIKVTSFNFEGLAVHGSDKGFQPACEIVRAKSNDFSAEDFLKLFDAVSSIAGVSVKQGKTFEKLNPRIKVDGKWARLYEVRPDLRRFAETLRNAREVLSRQFVNGLAFLAWPVFKRLKEEVSMLTFDDLVSRAHDAIVAESKLGEQSVLLKSIRHTYRIALVDEFQDTDGKQWEIFKSIFSDEVNKIDDGPKPKQGALLVVGDPKQAIYSFRGADVGAYLIAKGDITKYNAAARHSLDTTYRSSPKLVNAFNRIFGAKVGADPFWFEGMKEGDGSIDYEDVNPPPDGTEKFNGIAPHDEFGEPVELLESLPQDKEPKTPAASNSGYGNKTRCLPEFLRNTAREIKRLMALNPAYTTVDKDTGGRVPHTFSYRDMCILVRGHADANKAREILASANIPFSIYKEQGIYASAEAEALLALFDFLSVPSRRGRLEALLLTPLFGYSPDQLEARRKQEDREFSKQLDVWQELVSKKEWSKLFESVMNDTLLAHPAKDDSDFDRRWAATRQILDKLLEQVGRKAQTIDEFADVLRSWRQDDKRAGEDGALRRKESDADRVQIMTMHVSKGLEYPVVFIAWGFGELAYQVKDEEKEAAIREEKRLLYVALTRAEHKLYLPWSRWAQHQRLVKSKAANEKIPVSETGIGSAGSALLIQEGNPNSGFLARGIRAFFKSDDAAKCDDAAKAAVMKVSERLRKFDSMPKSTSKQDAATEVGAADPKIKVYELDANALARQKIDDDSYSSVHRKAKKAVESADDAGKGDENHDDDMSQNKKTLLPRNNISGDVFHEIMETLCNNDDSDGETLGFCTVGKADFGTLVKKAKSPLLSLIGKVMRKHQLSSQKGAKDAQKDAKGETTELVLARMVWRVLNIPIVIGGRPIVLKDIGASNRRAELEFVVNRAKVLGDEVASDGGGRGATALPDPQSESTFNGKIDLLVRPDGLGAPVYILDWKTNSLSDYGSKALERSMTKSDYHLQYRFYSQAVRYWLHGAELGGVAYLYVRAGEHSKSLEGDTGVFVAKAADISQETCRAAIKDALK